MKLVLISALFWTSLAFGQDYKLSATRQFWAAGFSYNSGVNFSVTITLPENEMAYNLDVDSIYCEQLSFYQQDFSVWRNKNILKIDFGYRKNHTGILDKIPNPTLNPKIVFCHQGQRKELELLDIKELDYIAYP